MLLLDHYIAQTGKQPADWTDDDIKNYVDHLKTHIAELFAPGTRDHPRLFDGEHAAVQPAQRRPIAADCGSLSDHREGNGTHCSGRIYPGEDRT